MKVSKVLAIVVLITLSSNAFASTKQYRLMGEAPFGTRIRSVDATSPIPFNKRYVELSDEQQELFRSRYQNLSENVQPPFPIKGLRAIYRPILKKNKSLADKGTLSLSIFVDESGLVESLTVVESPSIEMQKYVSEVLRDVKFEPAICAGDPCDMEFPVELVLK